MAAGLPKACGASTGIRRVVRQAQVSAAPIVGSATVSPCSNSQKQPHIRKLVEKAKALVGVWERFGASKGHALEKLLWVFKDSSCDHDP